MDLQLAGIRCPPLCYTGILYPVQDRVKYWSNGPAPQHEFLPTYVKSLWNDDLSTNIFQIYCDYNQIRIYLCVRKEYSLFFKLCKIDLMPADKVGFSMPLWPRPRSDKFLLGIHHHQHVLWILINSAISRPIELKLFVVSL